MPSPADVEAILASLTLEQKISLLAGSSFHSTTAIPQKNVPSIKTADGPNGVRAPATGSDIRSACFPAACSLAATFDPELARRFGIALAEEARAMNTNCILGPTVCIHRHPLGGRNFESFSEDPLLAGKMASQVIQGLQERGIAATIKHFAANEQETSRTSVDETISERTLREIYLRPFEIAIREAHPWAVMTAYNLVNGTHCDSHVWLLREILRKGWGWNGLVMSDWGGTNSVIDALNAGLDLEMPGPPRARKLSAVLKAIEDGNLSISTINDRARAVLQLALKLEKLEHSVIPTSASDSPEHQRLIREAGARGIVMLKNDEQILPLSREKVKGKRIALVGFAKHALAHGGGSASVNSHYQITPEMGLKAAFGDDVEFTYSQGAHRERLLFPLSAEGPEGTVTGLDGSSGYSLLLKSDEKQSAVSRHGLSASEYSPLGSNESFQRTLEIIGDFTPAETGLHYISCSGFGSTQAYIDDQLVFEQKENTRDPMGMLFKAAPEPEFRHQFVAGQVYRIRLCSEPPANIGLEVMEGRSGARLGFSLESVHDADLQGIARQVAADADYAIIFTGHDPQWETEGQDQASFHLPNKQDDLIMAVASVNRNVIVVNSTGVAVAMPWLDQVKGMLQAWFPGQECGNAIADVITGAVNPEGRLPVSFPRRIEDSPAHGNFPGECAGGQLRVSYAEGIFVGYRHYDRVAAESLNFPFGYGLSYTTFDLGDLEIQSLNTNSFDVVVDVGNSGAVAGAVLVQLYVGRLEHSADHPIKVLAAFDKVHLEAGQTKVVRLAIQTKDCAYFDDRLQKWRLDAGEYKVSLGSSSAEILKSARLPLPGMSWEP
ncbi:glycoside hydrolase superfamily [Aspergillus californicus]